MNSGKVNLDTCDEEPIHLIGAVQPHGALIAIDARSEVVEFASTNTEEFLGLPSEAALGLTLSELIGEANAKRLPDMPLARTTPEQLQPWFFEFEGRNGQSIKAECLPHRSEGHVVLEFVRPEEAPATVWEDELLRRGIISELVKPDALAELADASAKMIRQITGFDRVMIYKFAEDKHGEVIAESTSRPDSFLGLHYPASDIPDPARRHFTLNLIRSIPDINCENVPIISRQGFVADEGSPDPIDLTFSKFRAVAPVHIEYLNNMGVGASLSISLITNNQLWGLVACHHYGPRLISSSRLRFAELLGGTTSALLQSIENTNQLKKGIEAEKIAFRIEQEAREGATLRELIERHAQELMQSVDAQGLIFLVGGNVVSFGSVPATPLDYSGLRQVLADGIATSSQLSEIIEMDEDQKDLAAGAAYLDLSAGDQDAVIFLRCNFDQTIRWAGKPEKVETITKDGIARLSPRGSFALWREERQGHSKPFVASDREALRILRRALFALNSLEHEKSAREAQKLAEAEEDRVRHAFLDVARANSLGELAAAIAHELNQPLSAVANYVSACQQEFRNAGIALPGKSEKYIAEAVSESSRAGDLVRRIRNFISKGDINADYIDLNAAIKRGVDLALVTNELLYLNVKMSLDKNTPKIFADPVQIGQVILNLVRNSMTAMTQSKVQTVTISSEVTGSFVQISVADTGIGVADELRDHLFDPFHTTTTKGMGIGLSLCRSIVEAHSGKIWLEPAKSGAMFVFEVPLTGASDDEIG